jgi:predicted phage terminase large subunit-like protein
MSLSKNEQMELLRLLEEEHSKKCRENFYLFCVHMDEAFFTPDKKHLKVIADAFQGVADGRIKKLAISLPPRGGKSYITSLFCAWMLGKFPLGSVMRNSYAAKLAEKFSKDIRDGILTNPKYISVFPDVKLSKNSQAVDGWSIEGNSQPSYFCAGVGGAITGFGCKTLAILDDPIKNIEEALSETVIENTWNWYTSTHLSRLEIGCPEIHIATRWTKKDPIGRLTDEYSEEYDSDFVVICIPALDDNDRSFCESIKTTEEYHKLRRTMEDFIWEAEYMQNPIESKGLLFPVEELNRFKLKDLKGKADAIVSYVDTADKGTDSLCSPVGEKYGDKIYVTDVIFTQDGVEITEPLVAEQCISKKVDICKIESNNGGESFARNVRKITKGKSTCSVVAEHTSQNKETRILMKAGYIKENFYFRDDYEPGSDYDKYMRALTGYVKLGKNKHDDAPDATTGLAEFLPLVKIHRPKVYDTPDELNLYNRNKPKQNEITQSWLDY